MLVSNYSVTDFDLDHSKVAPDWNAYDVNESHDPVLRDLGINLEDADLSQDDKAQLGIF